MKEFEVRISGTVSVEAIYNLKAKNEDDAKAKIQKMFEEYLSVTYGDNIKHLPQQSDYALDDIEVEIVE